MLRDEHIKILEKNDSPSYQKIASIFELMNICDDISTKALYKTIKENPCELVRHEAIFALGEMAPNKETIDFLKQIIKEDKSQVVIHEALIAIGTIGDKDDIHFLNNYTKDNKFEISCSAKIGIDRITQKDTYQDVKENLDKYLEELKDTKNTTQNHRIQILFQLMLIGNDKAIEAIYDTLTKDICRVVRHEAGFVLGEIGTKRAVDLMGDALKIHQEPITIHETLFALGTSGKKEAIKYIEPFLTNKEYIISESAKIALDRIKYLDNPYSGARHFN